MGTVFVEGAAVGAVGGICTRTGGALSCYRSGADMPFGGSMTIACVNSGVLGGVLTAPILYAQGFKNGVHKGEANVCYDKGQE